MGLILDSSVLISAERQGKNARQMLTSIADKIVETEVGISVVTLVELAHGAARADTPERRANRQNFIAELLTAMPIHPVTVSLALRTGQLDGENQARGVRIPLSDLLIGVTALELGFSVATANLRHFRQVPGSRWFNSRVRRGAVHHHGNSFGLGTFSSALALVDFRNWSRRFGKTS